MMLPDTKLTYNDVLNIIVEFFKKFCYNIKAKKYRKETSIIRIKYMPEYTKKDEKKH